MQQKEYGDPLVCLISPFMRKYADISNETIAVKREICKDEATLKEVHAIFEAEVALLAEIERKQ